MSAVELVVAGYLASRLIEALEQAFVNWCSMKVRLGKDADDDDDDKSVGFG